MAKKKKVTIKAGNLRKVYVYTPLTIGDTDRKTRQAKAQITSEARKKINHKTAYNTLEALLCCNFGPHDLFVTLSYDNEHYPKNRKQALAYLRKFIRSLREERKRKHLPLMYVYSTEHKSAEDGRFHHHIIINATGPADLETIKAFWNYSEEQGIDVQRLSEGECYGRTMLGLAKYMTKEYPDTDNGEQSWTGSKNLKRPIKITEWIKENETVDFPPRAHEIDCLKHYNREYGGEFIYLKYYIPREEGEPGAWYY